VLPLFILFFVKFPFSIYNGPNGLTILLSTESTITVKKFVGTGLAPCNLHKVKGIVKPRKREIEGGAKDI
jgi:hypothetical protein